MRYAICLAGVPGRIVNAVIGALRNRFSDAHVFRGAGAEMRSNGLTVYDEKVVNDALRLSADAVFGKSKRPFGFCRNVDRPCQLRDASSKSCGFSQNHTCILDQPDFLVLFYQSGENESKLLDAFHFCAFPVRISHEAYDRQERTVAEIVAGLAHAAASMGQIRRSIQSVKSPLLIPEMNFRDKKLTRLLNEGDSLRRTTAEKQFKKEFFSKSRKAYLGRSDLGFAPAEMSARHGKSSVQDREDLGLSRAFRLGCGYPRDFHYDVSKDKGGDLDARISFHCREKGELWPKGTHVNVTVDDCVL